MATGLRVTADRIVPSVDLLSIAAQIVKRIWAALMSPRTVLSVSAQETASAKRDIAKFL